MKTIPFKYLCTDGGQYGLNIAATDYSDHGVPLLRTSDISKSGGASSPPLVRPPGDSRFVLASGDLLVSRSGSVGAAYLATALDEGSAFAGYLIRFRPDVTRADFRFNYYLAQSDYFRAAISSDAIVSTIANFNADRYASIAVPYPVLADQRKIADFLDDQVARIDKISAARRQVLVLMADAHTTYSKDLFLGAPQSVTSGISWMPRMGPSRRLWKISHAFRTGSGATPKATNDLYFHGTVPWINTSDLRDGHIVAAKRHVTKQALDDYSALTIYPEGTLLIAMYGATIGRVGVIDISACTNQACCALIPLGPIDVEYAFHWFVTFRNQIMTLSAGGGQPNISQEIVRSLLIPVPEAPLQQSTVLQEIRESAERVAALRNAALLSCDRLLELKRSLITAAVSGEFDVSSADGSQIPLERVGA